MLKIRPFSLAYLYLLIALIAGALGPSPTGFALTCDDRVAIAPTPGGDAKLSAWLADVASAWISKHERLRCSPFLPYESTVSSFDLVGTTAAYPVAIDGFHPKQIKYLAKKHNLQYLLSIDALSPGSSVMKATLYKIKDDGQVERKTRYRVPFSPDLAAQHRAQEVPRILASLAANAITTGFSDTDVYFNADPHYSNGTTTTHGIIPPILSAVSLTRIENPLGYRTFDYAGSVFPGAYLFAIDQDTILDRKPEVTDPSYQETVKLHFRTTGACGNLNASASGFWPLGTTYIGIGWGPCVYVSRVEDEASQWRLTSATRMFFGHRVFATDHLFFSIDVDMLLFNSDIYHSSYAKANEVERSSFDIGWYIPNSEGMFLKTWDSLFSWL